MNSALPLVFFSVLCAISGQLLLKIGMTRLGPIGASVLANPLGTILPVVSSPLVVLGLGCYVAGAISWLVVLSRLPLSLAYPVLAISYALIPILAWLLLGESVPGIRWIGIALISIGVVVVSQS